MAIVLPSTTSTLTSPLSLQDYFPDTATTKIPNRPTPFSPDYHPECDIILPASYSSSSSSSMNNRKQNHFNEIMELSAPVINLDISGDHQSLPPPPPTPISTSYYYPGDTNDALSNDLMSMSNNGGALGGYGGALSSFRSSASSESYRSSSASTINPILQKYFADITGYVLLNFA